MQLQSLEKQVKEGLDLRRQTVALRHLCIFGHVKLAKGRNELLGPLLGQDRLQSQVLLVA